MTSKSVGFVLIVAVIFSTAVALPSAQPKGKKEYTFTGKVEKVDPKAKVLTVNGENVQGWMAAMTMNYVVDKDEIFNKLKVGDQITAKVYDGDFKTLYDVKVVPPKDGQAPKK